MRMLANGPAIGRLVVLLAIVATQAHDAIGHMDARVRRAPDGTLVGLPSEYEPASLYLPPSIDTEHVVLRLGDKRLEFPDCLSVLFAKASRRDMRISASWFHDRKIMPYYIALQLPVAAPNTNGYYDGWAILVDLDKATVLSVKAIFTTCGGGCQREQRIDVETFCGGGRDRPGR
jgi:hypothetical protein